RCVLRGVEPARRDRWKPPYGRPKLVGRHATAERNVDTGSPGAPISGVGHPQPAGNGDRDDPSSLDRSRVASVRRQDPTEQDPSHWSPIAAIIYCGWLPSKYGESTPLRMIVARRVR